MLVDTKISSDPLRRRLRRLLPAERAEEAAAFIDLFHRENGLSDAARRARRREVARSLARDGWYEHTGEELAYGARVAWRNSAKCIGRLFWKSLEVVDCRALTEPDMIAASLFEHLRLAHAGDRVGSMISIFGPVRGAQSPPYVENRQLLQYAGYVRPGRGVLGDPLNAEFTLTALALGWSPTGEPGPFDVLPIIIRDSGGRRLAYPVPREVYREVPIAHPSHPRLQELGLRWYAIPFVSDMILTIGGVDYPCAPFNGYYMATEIASRNLVDGDRYNLLEAVGRAFQLDLADPLWRDVALTELNRAVLHAYGQAGVSICDHHTASERYLTFVEAEHAAARTPAGDWAWIVPPQASAACPTFHLAMHDNHDVPNFYRSRAIDGGELGVSHGTTMESKNIQRLRRLRKRLRQWVREQIR